MLLANWLDDRRRISRQRRTVERRFTDEVQQFEDSRAAAAAEERRARWTTAPDLAETVRRALLPSRMLWERRGSDDDFLRLAVGTGAACWSAVVDEGDAGALCGVPVVVGLAGRRLGLAGPRPSVAAAVRGLLVQAAAHHGPADLRIAVVTTPEHAADWEWLKWLPHVGEPSLLAINDGGLEDLCRHLRNDLDLLLLIDHDLAETASGAGASRTLDAAGSAAGRRLSAIAIADETSRLPAWCTTSLAVLPDGANASLQGEGADRWVGPVRLAGLPLHTAERCARALASLSDPASSDGGLPEHVVLDELFGRPVDSPSDIERRWRSHPTTSLRVPIGRTESGPFMFDLVADGPHALIGGTTGSGKSELLRTLIAGMAATVDPEHLQLVLLDFKGGSAFAPFADLPHTAGLVTDLDGTLARRALRALRAELRRREQVLKTVGATDLAAYYSEGHDREEPFPRLVVMVDEFATMAAELPDFVDSLVGIAQRGRSLGVHLVLATQRPHGAVNENVRANTSARLSLRVQDAADSRDVIGVDAAAGISRHRPGRGFCRLGHGEPGLAGLGALPGLRHLCRRHRRREQGAGNGRHPQGAAWGGAGLV